MRPLSEIETLITDLSAGPDAQAAANELLALSEEVLEHWIRALDAIPTSDKQEGFRLLALHRQGAKGEPSFNACRETCREIAWHYNLVTMNVAAAETTDLFIMMKMISMHLFLFVSGKMQVAELGDFCCSSKPVRLATDYETQSTREA